jgi:hypothetical protein
LKVDYYNVEILNIAEKGCSGVGLNEGSAVELRYGFTGIVLDQSGMFQVPSAYYYGFRIYNPTLGKFLIGHFVASECLYYSLFHYASDTSIVAMDVDQLGHECANGVIDPDGRFTECHYSGIPNPDSGNVPKEIQEWKLWLKLSGNYMNIKMSIDGKWEDVFSFFCITFLCMCESRIQRINDEKNQVLSDSLFKGGYKYYSRSQIDSLNDFVELGRHYELVRKGRQSVDGLLGDHKEYLWKTVHTRFESINGSENLIMRLNSESKYELGMSADILLLNITGGKLRLDDFSVNCNLY